MRHPKRAAVALLTSLALMPLVAHGDDQEQRHEVDRSAHEELREAVSKIRARYQTAPQLRTSWTNLGRPRLGIMVRGSSDSGDSNAPEGAEVLAVTPGSPAEEAGLKTGDVIISVNSTSLVEGGRSGPSDPATRLIELTRHLSDGEEVTLEVRRGETLQEFTVVARELDGPLMARGFLSGEKWGEGAEWSVRAPGSHIWMLPSGWMDMELVALNPGLGEYFGADEGVLVVRAPDRDESIGLESGDVILEIGGRQVSSPEHAMRILRSYVPEEDLVIRIVRHGHSQTLTGSVPESSSGFTYRWFNDSTED